ncbi:MAG: hypothetical protein RIA38_00420, partial [Microcella pacifica]
GDGQPNASIRLPVASARQECRAARGVGPRRATENPAQEVGYRQRAQLRAVSFESIATVTNGGGIRQLFRR